jgi:biopolymer transport protein ExbD
MKPSVEFSASSISDLVFLLLIFFVLTSNFVTTSSVEVELPRTSGGTPPEGSLSVTITNTGAYYWNDEEVEPGKGRAEKEAYVVSKIEEYLQDTTHENRVINFRGDTAISYGATTAIVAAVAKWGGAVALQTKE